MEEKKCILIVEDERAIVEILKFNLMREGYDTLEALDGVIAAEVSHEAGTAVVTLSGNVSDDTMKKAVEDQGYKVTAIN